MIAQILTDLYFALSASTGFALLTVCALDGAPTVATWLAPTPVLALVAKASTHRADQIGER